MLRSNAKALAFNLASFTWPGWDEKDFTPTASDMAVGLDAGRMLDGYVQMAEILASPENVPARVKFDAAVAALKADESDDAKACADQLLSVLAYFQR